jgi:hypothetical protein
MKLKLVTVVLASAVALASASASERIYKHHHYRNSYNSMNMTQDPAHAPSYGTAYYPHESNGYSSLPGGTNLSGTGSSQFGGGPGDGGGGGGGGP